MAWSIRCRVDNLYSECNKLQRDASRLNEEMRNTFINVTDHNTAAVGSCREDQK